MHYRQTRIKIAERPQDLLRRIADDLQMRDARTHRRAIRLARQYAKHIDRTESNPSDLTATLSPSK